ncbi:hypothetical protein F8O01_15885 [Pseudoclavibacter chungangensis]|uniref:Uncharacterized protein n=1 Tax=Pseudoclavibacter chungangensis TaxID=587635 RepID=A0A7J5BMU9_9MICO|nr:hypothetical protein [Pseudoclavibacter chungangensis]KAB1652963.1 hypothetical protein F8O01_15885 [Pseudoclavibacter chungangensis]NYJ65239.1 hypothetical protein [Pseudoclavibacter chungangensis]
MPFRETRDIGRSVVDGTLGAERANGADVATAAADARHLCTERSGDLHGEVPDTTRGADDEHACARPHRRDVPQRLQCRRRARILRPTGTSSGPTEATNEISSAFNAHPCRAPSSSARAFSSY